MTTQEHLEHSPDNSITAHPNSNVSNVKIEFGKEAVSLIVVLLFVITACGVIMGINLAKQAQLDNDFRDMKTQDWLKERRLMDAEAYMIANGIKVPGDDENGPTGNIQRMKPKEK